MLRLTMLGLLALMTACTENHYCPPEQDGPQAPVNDPDGDVFNPSCDCPGEEPQEPQEPCEPGGGQPVPEPGTMLLFGTGIATVGALNRRRKKREEASQDV